MDQSSEYIEMCRKAEELQHQWSSPKEGDFTIQVNDAKIPENVAVIGSLNGDILSIGRINDRGATYSFHPMHWIWLPRQDQLQEIYGEAWFIYHYALHKYYRASPSPEQAGLALIMMKQHSKKWNGSEWVNA